MEETYYLYRHIRLDEGTPFYIGIGKVYQPNAKTQEKYYSRAYQKTKRNRFWKFITEKTTYEVEIIFESDSRDIILQKEIEFISLYGRRDLGKGTLCNLTDGGDGMTNNVQSKETLKKRSELYYQGKTGLKTLKGGDSPLAKKVKEVATGRVINSCTEAANYLNISVSNFLEQLSNPLRNNKTGFVYLEEEYNKDYICRKRNVKIYDHSNNKIIESISEASMTYNISRRMLRSILEGKYKNKTSLVYYEDFLKGIKPDELYIDKKRLAVFNKMTGDIYMSISEAARKNNIPKSTLESKLHGRRPNNTDLIFFTNITTTLTNLQ